MQATRFCAAAAHVVMLDSYRRVGHSPESPGDPREIGEHIDWERTMALRRQLDGLGFCVAEAMDTAQRFQLGWPNASRLILSCGRLGLEHGFIAGAGADQLDEVPDQDQLIEAVIYQGRFIQEAGGEVILLPLPWLLRWGMDAEGFFRVYGAIISGLEGPLYLHWLGEQFQAELRGYFPGDSFLQVMALDPGKVRGAKLSLLDAERERRLRRSLLSQEQILLTGDDLNFVDLIASAEGGKAPPISKWLQIGQRQVALGDFSHALLGILDGIAEPASRALESLSQGRMRQYFEVMRPLLELSRLVFAEPTEHYKAGLAFLSWLGGRQPNFMLVNHVERERSLCHYLELARMASACGLVPDQEQAAKQLFHLEKELS